MVATTSTTTQSTIIPEPPALTGDPEADARSINDWMWDLYSIMAVQQGPLNPNTQQTPQPWDPNNLPNPTDTTLATAQQTANLAWRFATLINNTLTSPVTPPTP